MDADSPYASADILDRRPATAGMGWDYLVQMAPSEASANGLGSGAGVRQPLMPISGLVMPAQQQLMTHQMLLQQLPPQQLPGIAAQRALQIPQHAQQQQQAVHVPAHPMSILPNDAAVQQQAVGYQEDKQIAVQQAISTLSDSKLAQQAPLIAEAARRPDSISPGRAPLLAESALQAAPDLDQATDPVDSRPAIHTNGTHDSGAPISSDHDASLHSVPNASPAQLPPSAQLPAISNSSETEAVSSSMSPQAQQVLVPGAEQQHITSGVPAVLPSQPEAAPKMQISQHPSPPQLQAPLPATHSIPTPLSAQPLPKQASSLASLVPHAQHRPASAQMLAGPSGHVGRAPGAGPSREGTPALQGPATWVHEGALPLWFVKVFEEKRRRDVAMVAARAAQQAQRDTSAASKGLLTMSCPWRSQGKLAFSLLGL